MIDRTVPRIPGTVTENSFRELIRTYGVLERIMEAYFAQFGISGAQWGVLRNLHRAEQDGQPGLRLTDLVQRLLVRPASVTGLVDRLERLGMLARTTSTTDLRSKQVTLTEKGRRLVHRVLEVHKGQVESVMGCLDDPEQAEFYRLLTKLGNHLRMLQRPELARAADE